MCHVVNGTMAVVHVRGKPGCQSRKAGLVPRPAEEPAYSQAQGVWRHPFTRSGHASNGIQWARVRCAVLDPCPSAPLGSPEQELHSPPHGAWPCPFAAAGRDFPGGDSVRGKQEPDVGAAATAAARHGPVTRGAADLRVGASILPQQAL